jgi:hypothetical protein
LWRSTVGALRVLVLKWVALKLLGGHDSSVGKLRLAVCTVSCVYESNDRGEHSSWRKRWMVPIAQRVRCPPVCRSSGGQSVSDDGRCIGRYPNHPCIAVHYCFSSTLEFITVFSDDRVRVFCLGDSPHARIEPSRGSTKLFTPVDSSSYQARAIDMLMRLKSPARPSHEMSLADSSTEHHDHAMAGDTIDQPDAFSQPTFNCCET